MLVTGSFWNWNKKEEMLKTGNEFQRILVSWKLMSGFGKRCASV